MKLTPDQIEAQRPKFEAYVKFGRKAHRRNINRSYTGVYLDNLVMSKWSAWLACVEANLPTPSTGRPEPTPQVQNFPSNSEVVRDVVESVRHHSTPSSTWKENGEPDPWTECERIADLNAVNEALTNFSHDSTADNATCIVRAVLEGLAAPAAGDVPKIHVDFEVVSGSLTGTAAAKVKRIEPQDDGSYTVVIDHWPQPVVAVDADAMTRLRRVMIALKMEDPSEGDDAELHSLLFSVLGLVAYAVESRVAALNAWFDKTNWVTEYRDTAFHVRTMGMHRADIMRSEIEHLRDLVSSQYDQGLEAVAQHLEKTNGRVTFLSGAEAIDTIRSFKKGGNNAPR